MQKTLKIIREKMGHRTAPGKLKTKYIRDVLEKKNEQRIKVPVRKAV